MRAIYLIVVAWLIAFAAPAAAQHTSGDAEVRAAFETALHVLRERGAVLVDVALPHARHAIAVYYLVATAEASSNLARYDGVRYGLRAKADELRRTSSYVR